MKRRFSLALVAVLLLALTACGQSADPSPDTANRAPNTTQTTKTTTEIRPLSQRIVCIGCYCDNLPLRAKEMDILEVYETVSVLTCCFCGAVDGETAKFGDTVFVLAE